MSRDVRLYLDDILEACGRVRRYAAGLDRDGLTAHEMAYDAILRNLGASTIVAVGVSLNVAIPNLVMDAVNAGYRVVVPRDAAAGVPAEYGTAIIDNTLSLLASITTTDDLLAIWGT